MKVKFGFRYRHRPLNWHNTVTCTVQLYNIPVSTVNLIMPWQSVMLHLWVWISWQLLCPFSDNCLLTSHELQQTSKQLYHHNNNIHLTSTGLITSNLWNYLQLQNGPQCRIDVKQTTFGLGLELGLLLLDGPYMISLPVSGLLLQHVYLALFPRYYHFSSVHETRIRTQKHPFYGPLDFVRDYPGKLLPEPMWILLKQETMSVSGISWAIYKSAPHRRQITMPVFIQAGCPSCCSTTASKHWDQNSNWMNKFRQLVRLLTNKDISMIVRGRLCIQQLCGEGGRG